MSFFSFRRRPTNQPAKAPKKNPLKFDQLEDRCTPAVISGYVFQDANNNGIFDNGELPIANSQIQLKNSQGLVVGTTVTDGNGKYVFDRDDSTNTQSQVLTKTVTFSKKQLNFDLTAALDQFDPSLGTLEKIELIHEASVESNFQVENLNTDTATTGNATVSGTMTLTAPGVNDALNLSANAGSFSLAKYDNNVDYAGNSGTSFGPRTATNSNTITLTGADMNAYKGAGTVTIREKSKGTSQIDGDANLQIRITSSGESKITVKYTYKPSNGLKPGAYTIVQTSQPPTFIDGLESINNVPIPGSNTTDVIPVTLSTTDLVNNNFGEIKPSSISGRVFEDFNNNGVFDAGENAIAGVSVSLGGAAAQIAITDAQGYYSFDKLLPGSYSLKPNNPTGYLDGKDNIGNLGGTLVNGSATGINLPSGGQGSQYDFGYIKPAALSGTAYEDIDGNGVLSPGDNILPGVAVNITGTITGGGNYTQTVVTDANGGYSIGSLLPGSYSAGVTTPSGYVAAKANAGTTGGIATTNQISNIPVPFGANSQNNNFGAVKPTTLSGFVYQDNDTNGSKNAGDTGIAGVTVSLTGTDSYGNSVNRTVTSDANGFYSFTALVPGSYSISETQPAGYENATNNLGTRGGQVNGDTFVGILIASGQTGTDYNFGEKNPANADLSIVKTANVASVKVGDTLFYTLTITNSGPFAAQNVKVVDTLPSQAIFVSAAGDGWQISQANGVVTATRSNLGAGTATITIAIKAPALTSTITNTGTVSSDTPDKNPLNNTSTVTTPVTLDAAPQGQLVTNAAAVFNVWDYRYYAQWYNYQQYSNAPANGGASISNQTFVDGMYQMLTGASPDAATRNSLAGKLDGGTITRDAAIQQILNSDAHRGYLVQQAYQQVLGRAPSQSEKAAGIQSLTNGQTQNNLLAQLTGTSEYQAKYAGSQGLLVAGIYKDLLYSLPTQSAYAASLQSMSNGTVIQASTDLLNSAEGISATIGRIYRQVLKRSATSSEIATYLPQFQTNVMTSEKLVSTLLGTSEFYTLALNSRAS
ncbi:MAG: choice-of-anchor E domain-containing protein [Gemmataceae bacterium]|nr:choice-of-anchor E domain-containing protein [Gemmataceae bacterium]